MKNYITTAIISLIVGLLAGYAFHPQSSLLSGNAGTSGDTYGTAKVAGETIVSGTLTGASTTPVYSILNSDGRDRIITSIDYYFQGLAQIDNTTGGANVATSSLILTAATSTTATGFGSGANRVLNTAVATTTAELYIGTTTPGSTATAINRVWASGAYLNMFFNATSSATGVISVKYTNQ